MQNFRTSASFCYRGGGGTQNYGITDFDNYSSGTVTYDIPVGQDFTGSSMSLILVNDNDAGSSNNSSSPTSSALLKAW